MSKEQVLGNIDADYTNTGTILIGERSVQLDMGKLWSLIIIERNSDFNIVSGIDANYLMVANATHIYC